MSKHSKRRNSGLLYEFLVKEIAACVVENDKQKSQKALKILKKWFKPETNIYKEFRLANSLVKTTVSKETIATSILAEARNAVRQIDVKELDREKSLLIRDINHSLGQDRIWEHRINGYKVWATVQTLFNAWSQNSGNLQEMAEYEDKLVHYLCENKEASDNEKQEKLSRGQSKLVLKIMEQKFDEKWKAILSPLQKQIVREWAHASETGDDKRLNELLDQVKTKLNDSIKAYSLTEKNKGMLEKLNEAKSVINNEKSNVLDEEMVTRFLVYTKLMDELESEDKK